MSNHKPSTARRVAGIAAIAAGVLFLCPASAHADPDDITPAETNAAASYGPAICEALDEAPTLPAVTLTVEKVIGAGYSASDTGTIVFLAVASQCPSHLGLLKQWADAVSPETTGGAIT